MKRTIIAGGDGKLELATDLTDAHRTTLLELALLVTERHSVGEVFLEFAARLIEQATFDFTTLLALDAERNVMVEVGAFPETLPGRRPHDEVSLEDAHWDVLLKYPDGVQYEPSAAEGGEVSILVEHGFQRVWSIPLVANGPVLGHLTVARRENTPFRTVEMNFLRAASRLIAGAVAEEQRVRQAQQEAARSHLLNELSLLMNAGEPVTALFERMNTLLRKAIACDFVLLWGPSPRPNYLRQMGTYPAGVVDPRERSMAEPHLAAIISRKGLAQFRASRVTGSATADDLRAAGLDRSAVLPLWHDGAAVGALIIAKTTPARYSAEDVRFLDVVGTFLAQAIANEARLRESNDESMRRGILNDLSLKLNSGQPIEVAFSDVGPLIERALDAQLALIAVLSPSGETHVIASSPRDSVPANAPEVLERERVEEIRSATGAMSEYRCSRVDSEWTRILAANGYDRMVTAVFFDDTRPAGTLTIGRRDNRPFTASELAFVHVLRIIVGQAVENRRRINESRDDAEEQRILASIAAVCAREGEPAALVAGLNEQMASLFPAPVVGFGLLEGDFVLYPVPGRRPFRSARTEVDRRAERLGQVVDREFGEVRVSGSPLDFLGVHAISMTVARSGGNTIGFLVVGTQQPDYEFNERDLRLFRVVAQIAGPAVANSRAAERAREDAQHQRIVAMAAAAIATETTEEGLTAALARALQGIIPGASVTYIHLEGDHLVYNDGPNGEVESTLGISISAVLDRGQVVLLPHSPYTSAELRDGMARRGVVAALGTKVTVGGATTGVLLVGTRDSEFRFSERCRDLLNEVAQAFGPAVANIRNAVRAATEAEDQRILAEVAAVAAREPDQGALLQQMARSLERVCQGTFVAYGRVEDGLVHFRASDGGTTVRPLPRGVSTNGSGQLIHNRETATGPALQWFEARDVQSVIITALVTGGELRGILTIGTTSVTHEFNERQQKLFQLIAQIVGPAMENARAATRARKEAQEQATLAEVAAAAARESDPLALARAIIQPFRRIIPRPFVTFGHIEDDHIVYAEPSGEFRRSLGAHARETLRVGQLSFPRIPESMAHSERARSLGVEAFALTAALSGGETTGMLVVGCREPGYEFTPDDLRIFRLVAQIIGPAMANARAARKSRVEAEEQRLIAECAAVAARESDIAALLTGVRESLARFIPGVSVRFALFENDQQQVLYDRQGGREPSPIGWAAREAVVAGQVTGVGVSEGVTPWLRELHARGLQSWAMTSYRTGGETLGTLMVGSFDPSFEISERQLQLLHSVAGVVGPAITNIRAMERARAETEEQRLLAEIAAIAAREDEPARLLAEAAGPIGDFVPNARVWFGFLDADGGGHYRGADLRHDETVCGLRDALGDSGQAVVGALDRQGFAAGSPLEGLRSAVITWASAGGAQGLFVVGTSLPDHVYSDGDLRRIRQMTQIIGPAMFAAQTAAETERQRTLYNLMLQSLSESVLLMDDSLKAVYANSEGQHIVRAMAAEWRDKDAETRASLLDQPVGRALLAAAFDRKAGHGRTLFPMPDGERWFDYEMIPLDHPNYRLLLVANDVTNQVALEAERERSREQIQQAARLAALGELIGGVAHELNNPLTAILGFAELLQLTATDEHVAEELGIIHKEAMRARNIVRDLLFIARPSPVERSDVRLTDVVQHIERLRRGQWNARGIVAEIDIDDNVVAWGNEHQVTQVLLNIVTNAEQAVASSPNPRLWITAGTNGRQSWLTVRDNGSGMDAATRERIFEPFFTTKQGNHGTGLGLSLSYSIIAAHSGSVEVESEPGAGTSFKVILPASPAISMAPMETPVVTGVEHATVLVIDDEPSLRRVCQRLVTSMGYDCYVADSSASALEQVREHDFDLILCDYRLGIETADAVVAAFLAHAPELVGRIVIATGATTDPGVVELTARHNLRLIAKPYGFEEIARVMNEVRGEEFAVAS